MDKTKVMVYFSLHGDEFPIDRVTDVLEIEPTTFYTKGDLIERSACSQQMSAEDRYRLETTWDLSTGYQESFDVGKQLDVILTQLKNKGDSINHLKADYRLDCQFSIIIIMEQGHTPALHITNEQIAFAHSIQAEFVFDLYANPYEDELC